LNIEIGGGHLVTPGWTNLDPVNGDGPWRRRAQDVQGPAADNSVGAIRASHVMEHIPAGADRIAVMNEAHRVLAPGGTFEIVVPLVLAHGQWVGTWHAFADPTHVSFWCLPESWLYFTVGPFKPNADYGMRIWSALREEDMRVEAGWEGHVILRKP
jgi:hypothetical protein